MTLQSWKEYVEIKDKPKKKVKIKDKELPKMNPWVQQSRGMYQNQGQYYLPYYPMPQTYYNCGYHFDYY
jgi:hypothetical protein